MRHGGFDAVVSNPPFIGGKKVSGALGTDYREYLKQRLAKDKPGNADLCAYFLLRDLSIAGHGRVGMIATNSIAQGQSREVGLDQVVDMGWAVYRAEKTQPWPGVASIEVSLVWTGHPGEDERFVLDGNGVSGITSSLEQQSLMGGKPQLLTANSGIAFQGAMILGSGFFLTAEIARELTGRDPQCSSIIFPYLNGDDLNSSCDFTASRLAINFGEMTQSEASRYNACWDYAIEHILPGRIQLDQKTYPGFLERWWQYWRPRGELMHVISSLHRVIVITLVSRTCMPVRVPTGQVFSNALGVFATDRASHLTLLTSSQHLFWWTTKGESSLRTDPRYTPSDGFETFPQPGLTAQMDRVGEELEAFRSGAMERRLTGLTALYNLVHNDSVQDGDIARLREIHVEIDETVREAYALDEEREPEIRAYEDRVTSGALPTWREIELGHGFHETRQGARFTISPQARIDVLDKLLALNHYRYDQEVKKGLHSGKGRGASRKKGAGRVTPGTGPILEDGGLFPPEGALF